MTDITELAQSKSLRKKLNRRLNDAYGFQRTSGGKHTTISLSIDECKSIIATMDERLALVDALEKAQKRISRLESRSVKLPKAMSIEGGAYCSAHAHYDSDGDYYDRTDVEEMLSAAGIKVEVE
ncbi:TPA: hypothetical protein MAV35_001493 [Klebsiella pneumoniae]|nr:hypothetical protein [Klebsiella pneumoniae]